MKHVTFESYGSPEVLRTSRVTKPFPKKNEILVKVKYTSVQAPDWRLRKMNLPGGMELLARLFFGFFKPRKKILGTELSGTVEEVGKDVSSYKKGDDIIALMGKKLGAYTEYIVLDENYIIVKKESSISFAEAAVLSFGFITAYEFLTKKIRIRKGEKVLIHGASGPVGLAAIQLSKKYGANVTAVCQSHNSQLVKNIGADDFIDYTKEDFKLSNKKYDVILDVTGLLSAKNSFNSLCSNGKVLLLSASLWQMLSGLLINLFSNKKVVTGVAEESRRALAYIVSEVSKGNLVVVIEKEFSLEEISLAHKYAEKRHRKGNIAIKVSS